MVMAHCFLETMKMNVETSVKVGKELNCTTELQNFRSTKNRDVRYCMCCAEF